MTRHHLSTAAWLCFAAGAFALGYYIQPEQHGGAGGRSASSASPTGLTGERRASGGTTTTTTETSTSRAGAIPKLLPLTSEDIAELGRQVRGAKDPLARREAFAKLLAGLTAENALEIRKQIASLNSNDPNFRDFHFAWGKIGGRDAVLHGAESEQQDMGATMAGWASADPAAAKAWYDSLEEKAEKGPSRDELKESLVHGLAIADPGQAVDFVMALGEADDPDSKRMMSILMDKLIQSDGAAGAAERAIAMPEGDLRGHALSEVARAQARKDPAAAAAWAATLAGDKNGSSIVYGISSEWGSRNGAATVQWLDSLGGNQSAAYGPALGGWAKVDPLAASQYVAAMPPSASRDSAIGGMVHSHRWEDPVASITWANQISDPKGRQDVLTMTAEAYVRKDPAAAAAWLPSSGLPAETQQRLLSRRR